MLGKKVMLMDAKTLVLVASFSCVMPCVFGAYQEAPPAPVVQYRPDGQKNLVTVDADLRTQMGNLDQQIQKLAAQREEQRARAESAAESAANFLQQYHDALDLQQNYQRQMQATDDNIAQLVRKKADITKQIKK